MSHYIEPRSVNSYLSGICNQLETYFPDIWTYRKSALVKQSLKDFKRLFSQPVHRVSALSIEDIDRTRCRYVSIPFSQQSIISCRPRRRFFWTPSPGRTYRPRRPSSSFNPQIYNLRVRRPLYVTLRSHKADPFFEGSIVHIAARDDTVDTLAVLSAYLHSRDARVFGCVHSCGCATMALYPLNRGSKHASVNSFRHLMSVDTPSAQVVQHSSPSQDGPITGYRRSAGGPARRSRSIFGSIPSFCKLSSFRNGTKLVSDVLNLSPSRNTSNLPFLLPSST
jgi:hypothetical protein